MKCIPVYLCKLWISSRITYAMNPTSIGSKRRGRRRYSYRGLTPVDPNAVARIRVASHRIASFYIGSRIEPTRRGFTVGNVCNRVYVRYAHPSDPCSVAPFQVPGETNERGTPKIGKFEARCAQVSVPPSSLPPYRTRDPVSACSGTLRNRSFTFARRGVGRRASVGFRTRGFLFFLLYREYKGRKKRRRRRKYFGPVILALPVA